VRNLSIIITKKLMWEDEQELILTTEAQTFLYIRESELQLKG